MRSITRKSVVGARRQNMLQVTHSHTLLLDDYQGRVVGSGLRTHNLTYYKKGFVFYLSVIKLIEAKQLDGEYKFPIPDPTKLFA